EVRSLLVLGARRAVPSRGCETLAKLGPTLHREFAGRQHDELVERGLGALRNRIERSKRLDLVAEELDPSGLLGRGGIDVDGPAAPREGAGLNHLGDRLVAKVEEPRRRLLPGDPITCAQSAPLS